MATYALIPGGGGDPWEWHRLVPELASRGQHAIAVRLPAEDDTAGWSEYADAVVDAIGDRADVILVAASMGGFTAPIVCTRRRVDLLVLLNAMIPMPGETFNAWGSNTGSGPARAKYHASVGLSPAQTEDDGLQLTAAPYLPSLISEGREGGGFDVSLTSVNALVFLQFKVSHYMTRGTAKGVSTGHLSVPYFRFDIHAPRSSDQHQLLLRLEQQPASPPHIVRYVAPAFYTEGQFDSAFLSNTVSDQSVFVAPSQIILPDDREHCVGFETPTDPPVVLSEPRRIDGNVDYAGFQREINRLVHEAKPIGLDSSEMQRFRDMVLELAVEVEPEAKPERLFGSARWVETERVPRQERMPRIEEQRLRRMRPLDAIGQIAWTQFGCQTVALAPST